MYHLDFLAGGVYYYEGTSACFADLCTCGLQYYPAILSYDDDQ